MISTSERIQDPNLQQEKHWTGRQARVWTALPGIIASFDPVAMTCEVQPAIQGKQVLEDGTVQTVNIPMLLDCPVVYPHGGGVSLTFPIRAGDECLVVFASRAIDFWWQLGGVQPPAEPRMHDLSDGFVLVGAYSQPKVLGNVSTQAVQLRSDDGQAFFELNPESHDFNLMTPGNFTAQVQNFSVSCAAFSVSCSNFKVEASSSAAITAPTIALNGQITGGGSGGSTATFTGAIHASGDVTAGGISLNSHTHTCPDGETSGPH